MSEFSTVNVHAAFEMLLEVIEAEIDIINQSGAKAFAGRDYDRARAVLERASQFTSLRDKVVTLRTEWETVIGSNHNQVTASTSTLDSSAENNDNDKAPRASFGRLQRGLRTPEAAYYRPILKVLNDLGGRAKINEILDRVKDRMRDTLTEYDYQPLNSDPEVPRWRNAAQWARNAMVKEGLLKSDSPKGTWEITDDGRRLLAT